jgi:hypothetical protein
LVPLQPCHMSLHLYFLSQSHASSPVSSWWAQWFGNQALWLHYRFSCWTVTLCLISHTRLFWKYVLSTYKLWSFCYKFITTIWEVFDYVHILFAWIKIWMSYFASQTLVHWNSEVEGWNMRIQYYLKSLSNLSFW